MVLFPLPFFQEESNIVVMYNPFGPENFDLVAGQESATIC